jgi:hypothetical protein
VESPGFRSLTSLSINPPSTTLPSIPGKTKSISRSGRTGIPKLFSQTHFHSLPLPLPLSHSSFLSTNPQTHIFKLSQGIIHIKPPPFNPRPTPPPPFSLTETPNPHSTTFHHFHSWRLTVGDMDSKNASFSATAIHTRKHRIPFDLRS